MNVSGARTLLVAANDVFLDGVVDWVDDDARIEIVGRAHSGAQALEKVESLRAELVLLDTTLPDISGFEVARRIKSQPDAPLVIMLSFHDCEAVRLEAMTAGADGFVTKSETADRLLPLVGDLLRQRTVHVSERSASLSTMRVPPASATS
jgi:DNA-binding NarL/FixJ family response regulator